MKRSFFDRLSGTVNVGDSFDTFDDDIMPVAKSAPQAPAALKPTPSGSLAKLGVKEPAPAPLPTTEGQLPVDVYQTQNEIVVRTFVAGVRPDELSLSISRDMVVIEGSRMEREQVSEPDYFSRELFWGSFSRIIQLPQEIDVDNASASAKDGLLTLILPKLDKARQTKLKVRAG